MSGQPIVGLAPWQEELFPRDNSRFLIAGIQMPVPVRGQNVSAMAVQLEKTVAIYPGVDMVVFSELAPHGPLHACAAHDPSADEAVFQALAAKHRGEATADVTVAEQLSDAHLASLKEALKSVTGKDVALNVNVDPAIIGGLIVKLGSRMIDTSLRTKLNSMKHAMKEVG